MSEASGQALIGYGIPRPTMRGGTHAEWGQNTRPRSFAAQGPALIVPDSEKPTQWSKFGMFTPHPYRRAGHDELHGALMDVAQADLYDAHANPFPANPVYDVPNGPTSVLQLVRLEPTTSAHPGRSMSSGAGPTMYFTAPPVFAAQTIPIMAVGV